MSRASSRSEARAEAVGVGSSALFGPVAPPRPARPCPDSAPAVDSTTRPHPHDQRPQTRDRDNTPPVSTLDDAHRVWAPAPERCRIATATTHTRQPPHGRLEMGCLGRRAATAGARHLTSASVPRLAGPPPTPRAWLLRDGATGMPQTCTPHRGGTAASGHGVAPQTACGHAETPARPGPTDGRSPGP